MHNTKMMPERPNIQFWMRVEWRALPFLAVRARAKVSLSSFPSLSPAFLFLSLFLSRPGFSWLFVLACLSVSVIFHLGERTSWRQNTFSWKTPHFLHLHSRFWSQTGLLETWVRWEGFTVIKTIKILKYLSKAYFIINNKPVFLLNKLVCLFFRAIW